ncbi:centrosomal protein of 164 kDa-like [Scleropages formosus]|uniref:Centrosomal protein of 164 kDa n=1 Tax=Scleropages formosus TaxID=113540 RepID=A0A0P7VHK8_SCLFO|nr:centrosomal protein of 164 kDa-like [Scleropages formosus]
MVQFLPLYHERMFPNYAMNSAALQIGDQLILEEEYDETYIPSEQDIQEYAREIGIDPDREPELLWLAREGIVAPLPPEWKPCQDVTGDVYYFNFCTGQSTWDHPCEEYYRQLVVQERERAKSHSNPGKKKEKKEKKSKKGKKEKKDKEPMKIPDPVSATLGPLQAPLGTLAPLRGLSDGPMSSLHGSLSGSGTLEPLKIPLRVPVSGLGSTPEGQKQEESVSPSLPEFEVEEDKFSEEESLRGTPRLLKNLHLDLDSLGGGLQYEDSEASVEAAVEEKTEPELQGLALSADHSPEPPSQDSLRGRHLHSSPAGGSRACSSAAACPPTPDSQSPRQGEEEWEGEGDEVWEEEEEDEAEDKQQKNVAGGGDREEKSKEAEGCGQSEGMEMVERSIKSEDEEGIKSEQQAEEDSDACVNREEQNGAEEESKEVMEKCENDESDEVVERCVTSQGEDGKEEDEDVLRWVKSEEVRNREEGQLEQCVKTEDAGENDGEECDEVVERCVNSENEEDSEEVVEKCIKSEEEEGEDSDESEEEEGEDNDEVIERFVKTKKMEGMKEQDEGEVLERCIQSEEEDSVAVEEHNGTEVVDEYMHREEEGGRQCREPEEQCVKRDDECEKVMETGGEGRAGENEEEITQSLEKKGGHEKSVSEVDGTSKEEKAGFQKRKGREVKQQAPEQDPSSPEGSEASEHIDVALASFDNLKVAVQDKSLGGESQDTSCSGPRPEVEGGSMSLGKRLESCRGKLLRSPHADSTEQVLDQQVQGYKEELQLRLEEEKEREANAEFERALQERLRSMRKDIRKQEEQEEHRLQKEKEERIRILKQHLQEEEMQEEATLRKESQLRLKELRESVLQEGETQQQKLREEIESKLQQLRTAAEAEMMVEKEKLDRRRKADLESLRQENKDLLEAERHRLQKEREQQLEALRSEEKINDLQEDLRTPRPVQYLSSYQKELGDVLQEMRQEVQKDHSRKLELLREEHQRELESIRENHLVEESRQREQLLSVLQEERRRLLASHSSQLEDLRMQLNSQLQQTRQEQALKEAQLQEQGQLLELRIKELKDQTAVLQAEVLHGGKSIEFGRRDTAR